MGDTINYYDLEFSLQSAFRAFDTKNLGCIDAKDLRRALEIWAFRLNRNNFLSFFFVRKYRRSPYDEAFSNYLTLNWGYDIVQKLFSFYVQYTEVDPEEARQFIDDLDIDNDGSITYEEFTKHVSDSIVREALGVKNNHTVTNL